MRGESKETTSVAAIRRAVDMATSCRQVQTVRERPTPYECCAHPLSRNSINQHREFRPNAQAALTRRGCQRCNSRLVFVRALTVVVRQVRFERRFASVSPLSKQTSRDLFYRETTQTKPPAHRKTCRDCFAPPLHRGRACSRASTARIFRTILPSLSDPCWTRLLILSAIQSHPSPSLAHAFRSTRSRDRC